MALRRGDAIPEDCTPVGHLILQIPIGPDTLSTDGTLQAGGKLLLASRQSTYSSEIEGSGVDVCDGTFQRGYLPRVSLRKSSGGGGGGGGPAAVCNNAGTVRVFYNSDYSTPDFGGQVCEHAEFNHTYPLTEADGLDFIVPAAGPDIGPGHIHISFTGGTLSFTAVLGNGVSHSGGLIFPLNHNFDPPCYWLVTERPDLIVTQFGDAFPGLPWEALKVTNIDCDGNAHFFGDVALEFWTQGQQILIEFSPA